MVDKNIDFFQIEDNFSQTADVSSLPIFESKLDFIPKVTIAIPTYKRSKYLKEAIDSAINQIEYDDFDIIVVDNDPERDCDTEKLMLMYDNQRLSYYKNAKNIQMAGNWNRLFTLSKGKYLVMLHDDDLLMPVFLKECMTVVNAEPDLGILKPLSQSFKIDENISLESKTDNNAHKLERLYDLSNYSYYALGAPSGCLFRKDAFVKVGGFNQEMYPTMDLCFVVLFSSYFKVYKLHKVLSIYRWGENESLQCSTLRGFIINDYYLRRKLLNKYKVPYWVIDKYLSFLISNYENWCKSINKEFSFDLNDLNLKKQNEYIILIYRLLIKIYLGALLFYKRITS